MRSHRCLSLLKSTVVGTLIVASGSVGAGASGIPPVKAVDPSLVRAYSAGTLRLVNSNDYSNTAGPLFVPPVSLPEVNLVGDDINLAYPSPSCFMFDAVDEVTFAVRYGTNCPSNCDLYVLFYDTVNPGSTNPPVFDGFYAGFFLQNVATQAGTDVVYNVTGLYSGFSPINVDSNIGVVLMATAAGFYTPVQGVSILAAGSTPNALGGSGPDVGSSSNSLWCDMNADTDLTAGEEFSYSGPNLGNVYLDLKLVRFCPACTNPPVTYSYLVSGTANGTPWSWSIVSPTGEFQELEDLNCPGSSVSTLAVTQAFATAINSTGHCTPSGFSATATSLSATQAQLDITTTALRPIELFVGAAGLPPSCFVTTLPACGFNPSIVQVLLSGRDCNGNGVDDAMDIARGFSLDDDGDGIPNECDCPADFDLSGYVDTDDFDAFVRAFEVGEQDADFDLSGFVDTDDYDAFVHAFESGC